MSATGVGGSGGRTAADEASDGVAMPRRGRVLRAALAGGLGAALGALATFLAAAAALSRASVDDLGTAFAAVVALAATWTVLTGLVGYGLLRVLRVPSPGPTSLGGSVGILGVWLGAAARTGWPWTLAVVTLAAAGCFSVAAYAVSRVRAGALRVVAGVVSGALAALVLGAAVSGVALVQQARAAQDARVALGFTVYEVTELPAGYVADGGTTRGSLGGLTVPTYRNVFRYPSNALDDPRPFTLTEWGADAALGTGVRFDPPRDCGSSEALRGPHVVRPCQQVGTMPSGEPIWLAVDPASQEPFLATVVGGTHLTLGMGAGDGTVTRVQAVAVLRSVVPA